MFRTAIARTLAAKRLAQVPQSRHLATSIMYVRGLPANTTESDLARLVEKFGPVYEYSFMPKRAGDDFSVGFVKFYSGDLPSTVEELASLPHPSDAEIQDVTKRCTDAISAIDGTMLDGKVVGANFARKNLPDAIQFNARMAVRKANDPAFASRMEERKNRPREEAGSGGQYSAGYKDGFRDGVKQAQENRGSNRY